MRKRIRLLLNAGLLAASLGSAAAFALSASDVKCNGCVGASDVRKNAISTEHIQDNTIGANKLAPRSITTKKIKKHAVTGTKLAANVSGSPNVILVGSGGAYTNPRTAMLAIEDAAQNNPYVLILGPGIYELGNKPLQMKPWVDIRGSGANVSRIIGTPDTEAGDAGVVLGADHARLQAVTVIVDSAGKKSGRAAAILNQGSSPTLSHLKAVAGKKYGVGILNKDQAAPSIQDVVAKATGDKGEAIRNIDASPTIRTCELTGHRHGLRSGGGSRADVADTLITATAPTGDAVSSVSNSPTLLVNVIARARNDAIRNFSSNVVIRNVLAEGGASAVKNTGSSPHIYISRLVGGPAGFGVETVSGNPKLHSSQVEGGVSGNAVCVDSYDADFNALSCP